MDDCESSARGGGEEKSEGVATVDGSAFSLQELHLQLKQSVKLRNTGASILGIVGGGGGGSDDDDNNDDDDY